MPDAQSTTQDRKAAYKTIMDDHFPDDMTIIFGKGVGKQTLSYEKKSWVIGDTEKGLRYGENPGQEASLYRLVGGNLELGGVQCIQPGMALASDAKLLQSGKHPGKTNITDTDNALNILRYLTGKPACVILKHNNPCGAAYGSTLAEAYDRANMADRLAAFGGAIGLNQECDRETAEAIVKNYAEVVVAPGYAPGVIDIFAKKKNLRVLGIENMARLQEYAGKRVVEFKSLMDGGIVAQLSFVPETRTLEAIKAFPAAETVYKGQTFTIGRMPTEKEYEDLLFGWLVEAGVTSNSVLYVKDGVTVGIGTGEQDRVGVAEIARDKAYRKLADRFAWERHQTAYNALEQKLQSPIWEEVESKKGGLPGSTMVSDAFFPFRDGIEVGLREGVTAVVQPGGSDRDYESIQACNENDAAMVFVGQRSFKH